MIENVPVGILTVKTQCGQELCPLYGECQTPEGRARIAKCIIDAAMYDDPSLLPIEVQRGKALKQRPDDRLACMHLARLSGATLPQDTPEDVIIAERTLYWGVRRGFSKPESIHQPRE